jgi:rod shape determining protein RodA
MNEYSLGYRIHVDFILLFLVFILCSCGLVLLYSASGQNMDLVYSQMIKLLIALLCMILMAQVPPENLDRLSISLYIFGIILLLFVIAFGDIGKGAQRWLDLKIVRFQPSELMKIAVPMIISSYLSSRFLPPKFLRILIACIIIAIPVFLIAQQPDLGTALLVAVAGFSVIFIAGISWRFLLSIFILSALSVPMLWHFMRDYQKQRVLTLFNPENDPLGAGYHIIQSKIAIGSGGLYGKGWLNGTQSHLEFLPERSTDFIFAVLCEEFGMLGALVILSLYLLIILRGLYISYNAQNAFRQLLASGIILTFFVYIIVNMGMVTGQLPVVGVPLPLISYGGTSIVTLMAGFGILMSIHTHRRFLKR